MSTVWGTKHRLLVERCAELVDRLCGPVPVEPVLLEEQLVRLLLVVLRLLEQHDLNTRGRCRYCRWPNRSWRFWSRKPRCSIFRAVDQSMGQELAVVWWQLFAAIGRDVGLDEVRAWTTTTVPLRHDASTCPADAD
jgi:hypothetical protein